MPSSPPTRSSAAPLSRSRTGTAHRFPTWEYEFTRGYEPTGANHSWELQYVFGNLLDRFE